MSCMEFHEFSTPNAPSVSFVDLCLLAQGAFISMFVGPRWPYEQFSTTLKTRGACCIFVKCPFGRDSNPCPNRSREHTQLYNSVKRPRFIEGGARNHLTQPQAIASPTPLAVKRMPVLDRSRKPTHAEPFSDLPPHFRGQTTWN